MSLRVNTHIRSNVVGYVALFFALGLGSAWAAGLSPDSVRSKHIKDGHVQAAEVATDAIDGTKLADGTVGSLDVANGSLRGVDVGANSLDGSDIDESTLKLAAAASSQSDALCNPSSSTFVSCVGVQRDFIDESPALVIATARVLGNAFAESSCQLRRGTTTIEQAQASSSGHLTMVGSTTPQGPGSNDPKSDTITLHCNEQDGDAIYQQPEIDLFAVGG